MPCGRGGAILSGRGHVPPRSQTGLPDTRGVAPDNFIVQERSVMARTDIILPSEPARELPRVRSIGLAETQGRLGKGAR